MGQKHEQKADKPRHKTRTPPKPPAKRSKAMTQLKRPTVHEDFPTAKPAPSPVTPDAGMSEQDKDPKGGIGPAAPAEPPPGPAETIEEQGIGPRDPYPSKED